MEFLLIVFKARTFIKSGALIQFEVTTSHKKMEFVCIEI